MQPSPQPEKKKEKKKLSSEMLTVFADKANIAYFLLVGRYKLDRSVRVGVYKYKTDTFSLL